MPNTLPDFNSTLINKAKSLQSDFVFNTKYARYNPKKQRRESYEETVDRVKNMHIGNFPIVSDEIEKHFQAVKERKVIPSMRSMQFGGTPVNIMNHSIYNCAYDTVSYREFWYVLFKLLLGGTGVGYNVHHHFTNKLPRINPSKRSVYVIPDSIQGWALSTHYLINGYYGYNDIPIFDYSQIRSVGSPIETRGGTAPGPEPLRLAHQKIERILQQVKKGQKLTPLNVHDINCIIAEAVLSGGIRRSAMIALFAKNDMEIMECKNFDKIKDAPWRYQANNSVICFRNDVSYEKAITEQEFRQIVRYNRDSKSGEPGIFWTNSEDMGTNPCGEIGLHPGQFCNTTSILEEGVETQEEFLRRALAATFIGTLQAGYTDFKDLPPHWKKTTEDGALLGVSRTGISTNNIYDKVDMNYVVDEMIKLNKRVAKQIGIKPAHRITTVKPEGTGSIVLGTEAKGIHGVLYPMYWRYVEVNNSEPVYPYLKQTIPDLIEDVLVLDKNGQYVTVPGKSKLRIPIVNQGDNIIFNEQDTGVKILERIKHEYVNWILPGHIKGQNTHNVSTTVSVKPHEWNDVEDWLWHNREYYSSVALMEYWGIDTVESSIYRQLPYHPTTAENIQKDLHYLEDKVIDFTQINELKDTTNLTGELACAGNACFI